MPCLYTKLLRKFYSQSDMRYGVLSWYPFVVDALVLEQSGGALTSWLRTRCSVVASEPDCKDKKYDYVIIVDPAAVTVDFLKQCRNVLKPSGRLLLLFENPFGIQYFAGKRNPRTDLPFTFLTGESKKEVSIRLRLAGFPQQKWYYPFPNHYFAKEIYSEQYLPNEFMNHRPSDFLEDDYTKIFDERQLWREIIRNGAFEFLCNSYFVEATGEDVSSCDIDYATTTIYREPDRAFVTTLHANRIAKKTALHPEGIRRLETMAHTHDYLRSKGIQCVEGRLDGDSFVMPRLDFPTLWDWQTQMLSEGRLEKERLFRQFDYIRDCIYKANENGRVYWELGTANSFFDEDKDEIIFFDQEFYWDKVDPDIALVRSLWQLMWTDAVDAFSVTRQWLEELKERYRLNEKWDKLIPLAKDETHTYVFNTKATRPIEKSIERAVERVARFQRESIAESQRFNRFKQAAAKLRAMGKMRIVIYGYGVRGKTFANVLLMEDMNIVAILDNNIDGVKEITADAVVVTPRREGREIAGELRRITPTEVFVLEDLIASIGQ